MSPLGWIHFSPEFRDRVNTVLDMLEEEGMVDELGVGVFRDALADIFFPGISTIQTRAKYFFIVPSIIIDYINLPAGKRNGLGEYLNDWEHHIMWDLGARYNHDRNSKSGVIGITKIYGNKIARRPSSIYWNGIKKLEIIRTRLSLSDYVIRIDSLLSEKDTRSVSSNSGEGDDFDIGLLDNHGIKIPTWKAGWDKNLDLPLEYDEADFLKNRIEKSVPGSLLYEIIINPGLRKAFLSCHDFEIFAKEAVRVIKDLELKNNIAFAYDLNEVVKGLHFVYSNEINKMHFNDETYFRKWLNWKKDLNLMSGDNLTIERLKMISPDAGYYATEFMSHILEKVRNKKLDYEIFADLVRNQERNIKRHRSRFRPEATIDFKRGEPKSLSFMNYRYSNAQRIVKDIFDALK